MGETPEDAVKDETVVEDKKPDTTTGAKPATLTVEELQKQLDETKRHATNKEEEAAQVQKKLEKYQADEEQRKKDALSEVDRLKLEKQEAETKAANAEATLQAERTKNQVYAEANKAQFGESKKQKFIDADTAFALLSKDEIEKGIVSALSNLAKAKPFLLETTQADNSNGSPRRGKQTIQNEAKVDYKIPRL